MTSTSVVATDLSPHADEALRYARRLVVEGSSLHLVHVFTWTSTEHYGLTRGQLLRADEQGQIPEVVEHTLRQAALRAGLDPDETTLAFRSDLAVGPAVVDYVRDVDADILVVGTHGRRGVRRLMLGSVAGEVVRSAPCDVLVVPLNETAPWSERPTRRVLVPVDLTEISEPQVGRAREVAALVGDPEIELLHVAEPYPYAWLNASGSDVPPEVEQRLEVELASLAARSGAGIRMHHASGAPPHQIVRRAEQTDADLIVVASHNPDQIERLLLGSVTERLLLTADRPMLVVRPDAQASRRAAAPSTAASP